MAWATIHLHLSRFGWTLERTFGIWSFRETRAEILRTFKMEFTAWTAVSWSTLRVLARVWEVCEFQKISKPKTMATNGCPNRSTFSSKNLTWTQSNQPKSDKILNKWSISAGRVTLGARAVIWKSDSKRKGSNCSELWFPHNQKRFTRT